MDQRISHYIEATERLRRGDYHVEVPSGPLDDVGRLGQSLMALAHTLEIRRLELQRLDQITARINAGLLPDDVLNNVYDDFREIIPYNRIGFALIEDGQRIVARWAKSDQPTMRITRGFAAPLAGSTLQTILDTGEPRILNNLAEYLRQKPSSNSTRLIVEEGMRASLTCPLVANGYPVGFLFFSSVTPGAYTDVHVEVFKRIAGQLSVIVDKSSLIAELANRQTAIEEKNAELTRLNELKNAFLGMAAHDLRNPIAGIQMVANVLKESTFPLTDAERAAFLQDIYEQSAHMLQLLHDLLEVSQIESGRLVLAPEAVDVGQFLGRAVARYSQLAAPKGTRVVLETADPGCVQADPARLRQVIDNLISNAVKFSPPGSTVRVQGIQADAGWLLSVRDEGPGILPRDRARLFQDFSRLSARPTGGESSTGLGLAITRRIVEAHGGALGVESEPGHGATFWVRLPIPLD